MDSTNTIVVGWRYLRKKNREEIVRIPYQLDTSKRNENKPLETQQLGEEE